MASSSFCTEIEPPEEFICPITSEVMMDPLMTRAGLSFERAAILEWMSNHNNTCPLTRTPLRPSDLVTNSFLKKKISLWQKEHNIPAKGENRRSNVSRKQMNVFATFTIASANEALKRNPHVPKGTTMEQLVEGRC